MINLRVESLRLCYKLRSCLLQFEHLRCQFCELSSHVRIKFQGINPHKLCEKAILMKFILSLNNSNTP